jgi:hypothetical protein
MTQTSLAPIGPTRHASVDDLAWAHFDLLLRKRYFKARGNDFQSFFATLMQLAYGSDFHPLRPHGAKGDLKCDGYLQSSRTVFALYAPKDWDRRLSQAIAKLTDDHAGALVHWKNYMGCWALVHNDEEGLPAPIVQLLLQLQAKDPAVEIDHWGLERIRTIATPLAYMQLAELFGTVPTTRDVISLRQEALKAVIDDIAALIEHQEPHGLEDVRRVPPDKMEFNRLGNSTREMLTWGWRHSARVRQFFDRHPDPQVSTRIVAAFQKRYNDLRLTDIGNDSIYAELQDFAGIGPPRPTKLQVAGLAVLAYLFEECHIFERPPDATEGT